MKKFLNYALPACAIMLALATAAYAGGIGVYMNVGGGGHTHDVSTSDYTKVGPDASFTNVGAGIVFDSNTTGPGIFNYRLKFGGASFVKYEREADLKMSQMEMTNTFGFGIVRTKRVRFWLGPAIDVNVQWGESEAPRRYLGGLKTNELVPWWYGPTFGIPSTLFGVYLLAGSVVLPLYEFGLYQDECKKITFGGGAIGLTTGLNFAVVQSFVIGVELGFKYDLGAGSQKRSIYHSVLPWEYGNYKEKLFVHGWNLFGSIALMYRFGER